MDRIAPRCVDARARRELGSCVTLAGAVPHDDVPGWLSLMDVASAPYTPHDNFYFSPLKLFEYMASGLPVVAGCIGQVEEVIADGEHGLLHAPGDAGALAAALERLADDPELRHRLGANGRSRRRAVVSVGMLAGRRATSGYYDGGRFPSSSWRDAHPVSAPQSLAPSVLSR